MAKNVIKLREIDRVIVRLTDIVADETPNIFEGRSSGEVAELILALAKVVKELS